MRKLPFTQQELFHDHTFPVYDETCGEAAFLLGGIGAGNISLGARGNFRDAEIFHHPDKGFHAPYMHFALRYKAPGQPPRGMVLEAQMQPPFTKGLGFMPSTTAGLPRFAHSRMQVKYPFAEIDLWDDDLPIRAAMKAFTPFIPLNEDASGMPAFKVSYTLTNTGDVPLEVTVAGTLPNLAGACVRRSLHIRYFGTRKNAFREGAGIRGLHMGCEGLPSDSAFYGTMALATPENEVSYKEKWMGNRWFDGLQEYWSDLTEDGRLSGGMPIVDERPDGDRPGSLAVQKTLAPGEEKEFVFYIAWHFPNRVKAWGNPAAWHDEHFSGTEETVRVRYAALYKDAWNTAESLHANMDRFTGLSRKFADAFYGGSLPAYVLEAAAASITVLRSTTCIWLEDGTFMGWEGCDDHNGSCHGSCTHVWNYAQTLAFLFPHLEMSMRKTEFLKETDETGNMAFRSDSVFDKPRWKFHPAADGQMGTLVRLYREWLLTGDDDFLRSVWKNAVACMEFAFTYWDSDGDFVLDSQQHNTYDIEFYGPNSMVNTLFFAALAAMAKMAKYLGETALQKRYEEALALGSGRMDKMLWNGSYYPQKIEDVNAYPYQYGEGCLSDQIIGQYMAHVVGLGSILPEDHARIACRSIFENNFLQDFSRHPNLQRAYVFNREMGLLLCTWPHGGRPKLPFVYSDEVWTGIEYQVAATMIHEGLVEEGLTIVKALRARQDGVKRSPFDEMECGHHYARSMASYAVYLALTGFKLSRDGSMRFAPKLSQDSFTCFYCNGREWGVYTKDAAGEKTKSVYRRGE